MTCSLTTKKRAVYSDHLRLLMYEHSPFYLVNKFGVNKSFCYGSIHGYVSFFFSFLLSFLWDFGFRFPMFQCIHLQEAVYNCNGLGPVKDLMCEDVCDYYYIKREILECMLTDKDRPINVKFCLGSV